MFLNIRECLRMCEKSSTFAPFLHNLKISIKNMKNSIVRKTIFTFLLTVFSTFSVWGDVSCNQWIHDDLGSYGSDKYKISCPFGGTNIVSIQRPWGTDGIYVIFTGTITYCSLGAGNYEARGGGLLMNMSNFSAEETEVTVTAGGTNHTFTVYNAGATPPSPEPPCDTKHFYYVKIGGTAYDHVYMWNSSNTSEENAAWPGETMSTTVPELSILGASIYEISYESANYDKVIFNDGSNQTADLDIKNCKFYMDGTWYNTIEDVENHFVFYVNTPGWTDANVKTHIWKSGGSDLHPWNDAAEQMTLTSTTTSDAHKIYYYYISNPSSYDKAKFHNNGNNQSADLNIEYGHYFNYADDCWYTSIKSLNIDYSSSWHKIDFDWTNKTKTVMTAVASLPTGSTSYQFYIKGGGEEYYKNSGTMTNSNCTNRKMNGASNCWITADVRGDYIFNYDFAENKLSVVYPPYMTSVDCASATATSITLDVVSTRGTKYHVVDAVHGINTTLTPVAGQITIPNLTMNTSYTFTITALDNNDTESANSVSATCSTIAPPSTVNANRTDLDECRVLSVLGTTTYTPIGVTGYNNWGGGSGNVESIGGKDVVHIIGSNYLAVRHADKDVTFYTHLHVDIWMAEANNINLKLLCYSTGFEDGSTYAITTTAGAWKSLDIPLSSFNQGGNLQKAVGIYPVDLAGKDIYLANIYYYNDDETKPSVTAASHGAVTGDELTLTLTATYKEAAINTFRITNTTTGDVHYRTTNGSNQTTIPGIRYCEAYTLNIQAIYHDCILSDAWGMNIAAVAMPDGINIISSETVTATASHQETGYEPSKAIDGSDNTYWGSHTWTSDEEWLNLDLGRILVISSLQVAWNNNAASNLYIEGSRDGVNYYRLNHIKTAPTNYSVQPDPIVYETYVLKSHIRIRHIRLRVLNMTDETVIREIKVFGSCDAAYSDPVSSFVLLESQEINGSNKVDATIEVGAYDYETAYNDLYYKLSITPDGGSTTILDNQTATSGFITLTDLEPGTEYTVTVTARDGNNGNLADNYVTVVFTTLDVDPTICSREGGVGSGQSFAGASYFTAGYAYSVRKGDPGKLLISAQILDTDGEIGRVLLNFHSHSTNGNLYAEVELAAAAEHARTIIDREVTIPVAVAADEYASLSVKFEVGSGVRFTDRILYNLKDGGCAPDYFDIYHWDDAPVGERTSFEGGNIVLPIRYFRHFDTNWTTISVPFEVERVAVYDETDHLEYPLFPRFHNNSADVEGYYWLKTFPNWNTVPVPIRDFQTTWQQLTVATDYDGWDGGNISGPEETWLAANVKPEKNTPYAIKFPYSGYYETNWVIFYGAAFQTIASDFTGGTSITLTNDNYDYDQVKLQCNNTMHPSSALNNIYMIEEGTDLFTRRESQAVPAFESYVIGTHEVQTRYSVLRWSGSTPSTTDLDNRPTTADGAGKVYTVSGICVASFADSEQMETVLNTLNAGVYVVRVGSQINKVFVR